MGNDVGQIIIYSIKSETNFITSYKIILAFELCNAVERKKYHVFSSPCYSILDTAFLHKRMSPKSSTPKPRTSLIVVYLELVKASGAVHFIGMSVIFEALYTVEKKRRAKLFFTSLVYLLSTKFFMFTFFYYYIHC